MGGHAADGGGGGGGGAGACLQTGGNGGGAESGIMFRRLPRRVVENEGPGHVYKGGTVPHQANLYYIWITESPGGGDGGRRMRIFGKRSMGLMCRWRFCRRRSRRGVVVPVDIGAGIFDFCGGEERYRLKIVKIGHLSMDWKRTGRAWDDGAIGAGGGRRRNKVRAFLTRIGSLQETAGKC